MKLGVETIWQDRKRVLGMPLTFTKYFLSEDRLFMQTGMLNMKMEEVLLYRVSDIGVHVSLGQRIFGVGTIIIHSSDKSAPHLELKNVKDPLVVKELIHKHVEAMKTEHRIAAGRAGRIGRVLVAEGQEVAAGAAVVELEEAPGG